MMLQSSCQRLAPCGRRHRSSDPSIRHCIAAAFSQPHQQALRSALSTCPSTHAAPGATPSPSPRPCRSRHVCSATATPTAAQVVQDLSVSQAAGAIIQYAIEFARASQTYEVNSWMLVLGILKYEQCTAAKALRSMGLDDLYGAWHEVLWAMNVVDALETRPVVPEIGFADRAYRVLVGAGRFAEWGGRSKVQSEDILMALAAGAVLDGLFPDIKPSFDRVRQAVEQTAGGVYVLPDDEDSRPSSSDNFL